MFEHYDERARRTIFFARFEAAQLGSSEIFPEHVLLGLFGDSPAWACEVIRGVSEQQIRDEILGYFQLREEVRQPSPAEMSLSSESQEVLAAAEKEADGLAHSYVSNRHILLGLLQVENCFAAQLLQRHGLSVDFLREQTSILIEEEHAPPPTHGEAIPGPSQVERETYELDKRVIGLFQRNDYQGAIKSVDNALADSRLDRARTIRRLVPIASTIARRIGDLDLLEHYCELRLSCDPENVAALLALADCLALQGKTDQARDAARKSYELNIARSDTRGKRFAELIERRFPEIKPDAP